MTRTTLMRLAVLFSFAPCPAAFAQSGTPHDQAMAKLTQCMQMPAGSKQQAQCMDEVKALKAKLPAVPPMPTAAPQAAAMQAKPKAVQMQAPSQAQAQPQAQAKAAPVQAQPAAAPAPKVITPPPEVKQAAQSVGLAGPASNVGGVGSGIKVGDIQGMDLETAMMAVQSQRANLLESQLKEQMATIQARNDQVAKLNQLLADLKALRPTDPQKWGNLGKDKAAGQAMYARLQAQGLTFPSGADTVDEKGGDGIYDARQKTFDLWAEQIKGKIDALNSSQQMDMLRMQSLTNKRNESFEIMTNFIKKSADSRSSIIGNMR